VKSFKLAHNIFGLCVRVGSVAQSINLLLNSLDPQNSKFPQRWAEFHSFPGCLNKETFRVAICGFLKA